MSDDGADEEKNDHFANDGIQAQSAAMQQTRHQKAVPGTDDTAGGTTIHAYKKNVKIINDLKPDIDNQIDSFQLATQERLGIDREQ